MRSSRALAPLLLLLVTAKAVAQDDAAVTSAYEYAAEGLKAYDEGKPAEALDKLSRAYAIVKLPSLAVFMARAQVKLGRLVEAADLYAQALQLSDGPGDPEVQRNAREEAKAESEGLLNRIPHLTAQVLGVSASSVRFELDGISRPAAPARGWLVDPGSHRVTARFGNQLQAQSLVVSEGEARTIAFAFQATPNAGESKPALPPPEPSAGPRALRTATWVSFGMGGAALVVSGTTAIWALVTARDLNEMGGSWSVDSCESAPSRSKCNDYRHLRTVSTIGFYTGLVGVTAGTVLLLATPSEQSQQSAKPRVTPWVGVGSAGFLGQF